MDWSLADEGEPCGPGSCQGQVFTTAKSCVSGECVGGGASQSCDDGRECTSDACDATKGCVHEVLDGWCLVGGECRGEGQANPDNACQACFHAGLATGWSAATDGLVCESATCAAGVWKKRKTCLSAECTAGGGTLDCDDQIACTADDCEASNGCRNPVRPGKCLILGACWSSGDVNPSNACETCNPLVSDGSWTVSGDGVRCAAGSCVGSWWTQPRT